MKDACLIPEREMGVHEECGVIGIISERKRDLAKDIYIGLFALQHRGQESAGIAVSFKDNVAYYKNMGLVSEVFDEDSLNHLPDSDVALGHVRYSTKGSSNVINAQPIVFYGRRGRMAVSYNGNVINSDELRDDLTQRAVIFQSSTDSEVVAAVINDLSENSLEEGIAKAARKFVGAFAFVVLADGKLYAARDAHGLKPLVMGQRDGDVIFASESCAIEALDAQMVRDVEPGEIIVVDGGKIRSIHFAEGVKKPCIFEHVYLARSDSIMDGVSVYNARYECGRHLAKLYKINADIVAGVPDSALVAARGYSDVSGIPYADALTKNRYIGRTFIQPVQSQRETSVKIKLTAFRHNIQGKRLIIIDDSIVRGTTSKKIISLLRSCGAKEVHMLVASPIVKEPCYFGVDMETKEQLIGTGRTTEEICKIIGADSLHYLPLECLCHSCGGDFCTGCFNGDYGVDYKPYIKTN